MTGIICPTGPATSIVPANPAAPPLIINTSQIVRFSLNPANLAAIGARPTTRT